MRLRRSLLFGAICLAHALVLAMLCMARSSKAPDRAAGSAIVTVQLPEPHRTTSPPALPRRPVAAPVTKVFQKPVPAQPVACDIPGALEAVLTADEETAARLAAVPAADRSVANAVLLWDGQWTQSTADDDTDLLRQSILTALASQPASCLDQAVVGPRLITVGTTADAISLMFGSGNWRWRDLLESTSEPARSSPTQASIGSHQVP